jgi:hypothetical protein
VRKLVAVPIHLLAVVALTVEHPEKQLVRGQVGTVVAQLAPDVYEIEFCDDAGRSYAQLALSGDELLVLHHQPAAAE